MSKLVLEVEEGKKYFPDIKRLKEIRDEESKLKTEKEKLQEPIKELMGHHEELVVGDDLVITWRWDRDKTVFNMKKFQEEHPELVKKYSSTEPGARKFVIPK